MNKESLTTQAVLLEYCRRLYGEPRKQGNEWIFPCPFGNHKRPKLSVGVRDGRGVWRCWACGMNGDIYKLHAETHGLTGSRQFPDVVRGVVSVLGVTLDDDYSPMRTRRYHPPAAVKYTPPERPCLNNEPVFLAPEDEAAVWACVYRMKDDRPTRETLARELNLGEYALLLRSLFPERGALGITPEGRLLYVYTQPDSEGKLRVTGCKLRRRDNHPNPILKLTGGQWESYGTMNPTEKNPSGIRFIFPAGKLYAPWGYPEMPEKAAVIITEGESDSLAIGEAVEYYREAYGMAIDEETGEPYEDDQGSFEASLPAVVAIAGTSGFSEAWARLFRGKVVITAFDSDEAGRKAAARVHEILSPVTTVCHWTPPPPYKDPREMLSSVSELNVIESVMDSIRERRIAV